MSNNGKGGPIVVPPEVYAGLDYVRTSGEVNMLEAKSAAAVALEAGYTSTYTWIKKNVKQYLEGVYRGFTYEGKQ